MGTHTDPRCLCGLRGGRREWRWRVRLQVQMILPGSSHVTLTMDAPWLGPDVFIGKTRSNCDDPGRAPRVLPRHDASTDSTPCCRRRHPRTPPLLGAFFGQWNKFVCSVAQELRVKLQVLFHTWKNRARPWPPLAWSPQSSQIYDPAFSDKSTHA